MDRWHDEAVFAAGVQGLVNREEPRLFLDAMEQDGLWWSRITAPGQALASTRTVTLAAPEELLDRFGESVRGAVVWDPAVPATLNVATSVAGADDLVILRADSDPSSLFSRVLAREGHDFVKVNLVQKFTGSGVIPDTSRRSTGSRKCDAYVWLLERYLATGRLDWHFAGYLIDSWWLNHPNSIAMTQALNRDFLVAHRALVFDLANWADERPIDDPAQPLGTDLGTLRDLFQALWSRHGGTGVTQLLGFTPWPWKYTNWPGAGGHHDPVATEWDLVRIASAYNVVLDADAVPTNTMANATIWRFATLPDSRTPPPRPDVAELRDLGIYDNRLRNAGFDDDRALVGWLNQLQDVHLIDSARDARGGLHSIACRSGSLVQDVRAPISAGAVVHGSVWLRAASGEGEASLTLSSPAGTASRTATIRSDWQRVDTSFTAAAGAEEVSWQLAVTTGNVEVRIDSAALWIDGMSAGVSPRHYVVWHMGDWDAATWMYHELPRLWDDPRRGEVPLAWGFNPNLVDRFAIGFAHVWATAGDRDSFCAGDTVAGYVNVTNLYGRREPSGLSDARSAFETFATPYLRRAGVDCTVFALNGAAGPYDAVSFGLLARLTSAGVAYHPAGQVQFAPRLWSGTPFVAQAADLDSSSLERSAEAVHRASSGPAPGFHVFRSILASPGFISDLSARIQNDHPERLYTVLSPEAFFAVLRLDLQSKPASGQASRRLTP